MFSLSDFLRGFAEASAHVFFAYDPATGQLLYLSAAAAEVLGLSADPAVANEQLPELLARLHPDDLAYLTGFWPRWQAGEAGLPARPELRLRRLDGSEQWLALTLYCPPAASDEAGAPFWLGGTVEDISVAKSYTQNADLFNAKKNATLEILSHDLAGPFALLYQLADYVAAEVGPGADPILARQLAVMQTTCQDGIDLIRDFVDYEFMQSTQVALNLERHDLVDVVGSLVGYYQHEQQLVDKRFIFSASHPAIYAELDYNKFQQIINNLVSNAIKFTRDDGFIQVSVAQHPQHVLVTVADNGVGIPAQHLSDVFERFTPARRPGLRGEKTTGLGLSIVRTLVLLHKGQIWVESQEGQGTSFFIKLPQV